MDRLLAQARDGATDDRRLRSILLLGEGPLPATVARTLERRGVGVRWLRRPIDRELAAESARHDLAMIVSRDDIVVLRLALLLEHARPGTPMIVTLFDRTVASQVKRAVPHCQVVSMADLVAPALAGPCLAEGIGGLIERAGALHAVPDRLDHLAPLQASQPRLQTPRAFRPGRGSRLTASVLGALRPVDASARFLLLGVAGFVAILIGEFLLSLTALHEPGATALYQSVKELLTVGPNGAVERSSAAIKVLSALLMLAAMAFAAIVTAGIVNRLLDPRLTTIVGRRVVPWRDHVVIVGLGQVGLRLAVLLRDLGVGVVAIERSTQVPYLALARRYGVPVIVGSGSERALLERARIARARALAAVTSDELTNIAVAVAALAIREDLRVVLRAGEGELSVQTRALFHIGLVRDLHRIAGELLVARALGLPAAGVVVSDEALWLALDQPAGVMLEPLSESGQERQRAEAVPADGRP
jgi:hypothetical protein